jgi:class 3 adenylate cyclase
MAYNLGNIGLAYALKGQNVRAEENIKQAIRLLEKMGDHYPICVYLTYMSDIYLEKGDKVAALEYASQSLELAVRYGLKVEIRDANLKLSELYDNFGNYRLSNLYYKKYIAYRDSVKNIEYVKQMADLRADYEIAQKQVEVDLLEKESEIAALQSKRQKFIIYATSGSLLVVVILALGAMNRYQYIKRTNKIIREEKNRSESLLLNILPEETAQELMEKGSVKAQKFESITVLFSDFKGFTKLAEQVEPELLVNSIDFYFKKFDEITTRYGLEKIKTIGDAYMCAGGLPTVSDTHPRDVIQAAIDMIDLVNNELKSRNDLIHFEVRIGIHTGPVVAGIVGIKKWQYDIWGDTVNIASRMETNSEVGRINISETTYQEIKDEFPCQYRGEIEVKNRGVLKIYFLS